MRFQRTTRRWRLGRRSPGRSLPIPTVEEGETDVRKRVGLSTIAEKVGVSKTTVHYALHQPDRLGKETLEKVLAAAEELGYRPNLLARSLRTRRSNIFGVVCYGFGAEYFDPFYKAAEQAAQDQGYHLYAVASRVSAENERRVLETTVARAIDGAIVFPVNSEENTSFYHRLQEERFPFIFIQHTVPGVDCDYVGTDDLLGGQLVARRFLEMGRRRFAFVPPPDATGNEGWVHARRTGYNQVLKQAGFGPAVEPAPTADGLDYDEAVLEHARLLFASAEVDAVFAAKDRIAWGVLEASREAGRQVGRDLSLIGFDGALPSRYVSPPLTTVRQPTGQIGREAVKLLLARVEDPARPPVRKLLPPELVVRSSCAG